MHIFHVLEWFHETHHSAHTHTFTHIFIIINHERGSVPQRPAPDCHVKPESGGSVGVCGGLWSSVTSWTLATADLICAAAAQSQSSEEEERPGECQVTHAAMKRRQDYNQQMEPSRWARTAPGELQSDRGESSHGTLFRLRSLHAKEQIFFSLSFTPNISNSWANPSLRTE